MLRGIKIGGVWQLVLALPKVKSRGGRTWLSAQLMMNILYKTCVYLKYPFKYYIAA